MSVGENLLRYKKNQKYVAFDVEFCNLNLLVTNFPWQLGYQVFTQKEILEDQNIYVNWGDKFKISRDAARITHYDEDVVKKEGKDPKETYLKFRNILDNKSILIVGHNILSFDSILEKFWCEEVGEKHDWDYLTRLYDTSLLAKAIKKGIKPDINNLLAFQYKLSNFVERGLKTNLALLAREYGINNDENAGFHSANFDVDVTRQVFLKEIWQIEV